MKITKTQLLNIIREELESFIEEAQSHIRGEIYRYQGTEGSNSHEVVIDKDLGDQVVVKIVGDGFSRFKPGDHVKMSKDFFDSKFNERSVEDGIPVNTINLASDVESPADVLRSLGYMSEGLQHHILNKKPLTENVYRIGSDSYFELIREARAEFKKGNYNPLNEEEEEMLNSDLGEWAMFEGERVPLDFPMYTETLEEKKKKKKKKDPPIGKPMKNSGGGKKYKVFVRSPSGRIRKITYGDSKGGLKGNWNSAEARKSFASRHRCAEKKDRTKAGYWACRAHKDFGTNVPGRFW